MISDFLKKLLFIKEFSISGGEINILGSKHVMLGADALLGLQETDTSKAYDFVKDSVMKGSPAEKAGLKEGDIILEFNGIIIKSGNSLGSLINGKRIGDKVVLKVLRDGKEFEVPVTFEKRPDNI